MTLPYSKQHIRDEDIEAVVKTLKDTYLTQGPLIKEFEKKICEITGAKYCVVLANGTAALHLSALALGINKGDTGVTTPITFLASSNCFEYCNANSNFIDIDPKNLCISVEALDRYCKENGPPKIVTAVSFAGVPAPLPEIYELAKKWKFKLIEDAAHAFGSSYIHNGEEFQCGSAVHADCSILSFHAVKTITTGEGGAILTNDRELAEKLELLRSHGVEKRPEKISHHEPWYYEMQTLGYHYRLTDIQCALGISQLSLLPESTKRRQEIFRRYTQLFKNDERIICPPWPENTSPCFHLYAIQFRDGEDVRLKIYNHLKVNGIFTQVHYIPVYRQPYYVKKYNYAFERFPEAEKYYSRCLSLPIYYGLKDSEIDFIAEKVIEALNLFSL